MWNLFKTLRERDSARLRRLEGQLNDLTADVDICLNLIPKLNARLRQRARRAAGPDDDSADNRERDEPDFVMPSRVGEEQSASSLAPSTSDSDRSSLRAQLRSRARARGLLPSSGTHG